MIDSENEFGCGQYFSAIIVVPFIFCIILVFTLGEDDMIVPWLILTFIWYLFYHIQIDRVKKKRKEERDKKWKRDRIKGAKQDIKNYTKILNALESRKDKIYKEVEKADNLYWIKENKKWRLMIKRAEDELKRLKRK